MTYQSEITADSPVNWLKLDELSGTSAANSGSNGGNAGVAGAGVLWNQTTASSQIGGTSAYFPTSSTTGTVAVSATTVGTAWTFETWYKHDTGFTGNVMRQVFRLFVSGNDFRFFYNPITNQYNATDSGGLSATVTASGKNMGDGSWHHFVVTKSGTTLTMYVDNTQVATMTGTVNTKTNALFRIGSNTSGGADALGAWLDEAAFYGSALSTTRIGAHYSAAASTSIHAVAPVSTISMTAPAPVVTAIKADYTAHATAAAISMTAPAPVITPNKGTVRNPVPAATISMSTPNVTGRVTSDIHIAAPATTLNLSAPNAKVTMGPQKLVITEDRVIGPSSAADYFRDAVSINVQSTGTNDRMVGLKFPSPIVPEGFEVQSVMLGMVYGGGTTTAASRAMTGHLILSDWSEADDVVPTYEATGHAITVNGSANSVRDVTAIFKAAFESGAANYGLLLKNIATTGGYTGFTTSESATTTSRPYLLVTIAELPPTVSVHPVVSGAMSVNVSAIPGSVTTTASPRVTAPVMTTDVTFVGGQDANPDTRVIAGIMEGGINAPNANVQIRYPVSVVVSGAMQISLTSYAASVNLTTNRLAKVNNAMSITARVPGIFVKEADRYYKQVPLTIDSEDIWYQMEEINATRALDSAIISSLSGNSLQRRNDGYYFGDGIAFQQEGPQLRKAVSFNGISDYLVVGPYSNAGDKYDTPSERITPGMAITVEFSIKTSTQNGVIFNAPGGVWYPYANTSMTRTQYPALNGNTLRIVNGELVIENLKSKTRNKTGAHIADGEWHHVILSIPADIPSLSIFWSQSPMSFIMVDGKPVIQRLGNWWGTGDTWAPHSFMADVAPLWDVATNAPIKNTTVKSPIAGSLRDVIVRNGYGVSVTTAEKLYYEWSNSLIMQPTAATISLSAVNPTRARGNRKRMLLVYGLPEYIDSYQAEHGTGLGAVGKPIANYYSNAAGYVVSNFGDAQKNDAGIRTQDFDQFDYGSPYVNAFGQVIYPEVRPFPMGEYMVYPVSIGSLSSVSSAPGLTNYESFNNPDGVSPYDNETGLRRFINLQEDLAMPVTDFDVLTVLNYPWAVPEAVSRRRGTNNKYNIGPVADAYTQEHPRNGLTDSEWTVARDRFRDSVLDAAYNGVSLWIPEIWAAEHLGFIQAWDQHRTGEFPGDSFNSAYINRRAIDLDRAHGLTSQPNAAENPDVAGYGFWPQSARFRRIVTTEPGLTDIEAWETKEGIDFFYVDEFRGGQGVAFDYYKRAWQPGDLVEMSLGWFGGNTSNASGGRPGIFSARPEGIVGKVISREMTNYYGPNGVVLDNPYKDNAVTIVAERGTVVRGRAIKGRVFMEFMDSETIQNTPYYIDDPDYPINDTNAASSTWMYDERRQKVISVELIRTQLFRAKDGGFEVKRLSEYYLSATNGKYISLERKTMNQRGLHWLAQAAQIPAGEARLFVLPITVNVTAPPVTFSKTRNLVNTVVGPMRLDLQVRQPKNYRDGQVIERALPMVLNLEVHGTGKHVKVPAAEITLEMRQGTRGIGGGDRITVYLDGDRNITLFLKEDN